MLTNNENLIELFETERWLYVDGSLDEKRTEFWDNKIENNLKLKELLTDAQKYSANFYEEIEADLSEDKFNKFVSNAIEQSTRKSINSMIKGFFTKTKGVQNSRSLKIAFAGSIFVIIIVTLFSLQYPTQQHKVDSKFLTWDDSSFSKELSATKIEYTSLFDNQAKQYIRYQLANDKWFRDVVSIQNEINKLSLTTDTKSL